MISSQAHQYAAWFYEIVQQSDMDFEQSGLKITSVIQMAGLAVVSGDILLSLIRAIPSERLKRIRKNLVDWHSER